MRWLVNGICMVPMQAQTFVEAETAERAMELAQAQFKTRPDALLVSGSADENAAWDWRPEVTPND